MSDDTPGWPREEKTRSLFEDSQIGLNLCRLDGLWIESNQAFLDIIGYSAEEADGGLTYWELTPREYDDQEEVQLALIRDTGRYGPYEKEFIRKDGTRVPVRLNGFTIERDGETFIWSMIEDISTERELTNQLEAERTMAHEASRLATIGELAAGFAHEINNPIAIIDGYVSALPSIIESGDAELATEAVEAMADAVHRITRIVNGMRTFAREDAGEFEADVPLSQVIDDAVRLTGRRLAHHGVGLTVDAVDTVIRCRPIELAQVLVNLINNAFDAVREAKGAEVHIDARIIGDEVEITVTDTGQRPPDEILDRVFEPFFTTKPVGEGTGLGLSISRGIVGKLGGQLYTDRANVNTRFVARFPAKVVD